METRPVAALEAGELERFATMLRGELIRPADAGYDAARRLHNAMIDRHPGAIARCAGVGDVLAAVDFARRNRLCVAVRGGGHNVTGNAICDDGLVIDLSRMKGLRIDPAQRTARAEPGLTWGELNHDLQAFGLGATGGYISVTGVPGLTLGGGLGWLVRKYGLAMDNLLSADVVTADGRFLTASPTEHPDLFWGIRGAGANFGIATSFEFRVHPVGNVLAGPIIHPMTRGKDVLRLFRENVPRAPDDLTWGVIFFTGPETPEFPPALHGAQLITPAVCWAGPIGDGEAFLKPIREFGPPIADLVTVMPYSAAQRAADFLLPPGLRNYWKSNFLRDLDDKAIDVLVEHFARVPSPRTIMILDHNGGGAISRVGDAETAYGHRSWTYNLVVISAWRDPADDDRNIAWLRGLWSDLQPSLANVVYVNYAGESGPEAIMQAYPSGVRERLVALKNQYDPDNFFRMNHNIRPTA
ncbi:MAG TPA: FAD-binding oxidoreductase [Anaeromyxobacteraceae bacterium]|nr:FAD-binding oxidoreductase [Anaeromyxobacteraceae bacterium]